MDEYPFCSVVIPALNEEQSIEKCLLSLNNQTYPRNRYEVIVIDNGSTDSTRTIADKYTDKILLKPGANVGAVRNEGALKARGEILICTDADCVYDRNWIESGVNLLKSNSNHVFGGGLKTGDTPSWIEKYWLLNEHGNNTMQQRDLMGSCIFSWKSNFIEAGGFREDITSGEDTELSKSLRRNGNTISINKALSVVHLGNAETIKTFSRRQIWHAENYFRNLNESIKDPIFYLTIFFLTFLITLTISFFLSPRFSTAWLLLTLLMPAVLSAKRIFRAKVSGHVSLKSLPFIYALDLIYLFSRSLGLIKGIKEYFENFTRRLWKIFEK